MADFLALALSPARDSDAPRRLHRRSRRGTDVNATLRVIRALRGNAALQRARSAKREELLKAEQVDGPSSTDFYRKAAFQSPPNPTHAAAVVGVDRKTVRRMRAVVAAFVLDCQLCLLQNLIILASVHRPLVLVTREAWDETGQVFSFPAGADIPKARRIWSLECHPHVFYYPTLDPN